MNRGKLEKIAKWTGYGLFLTAVTTINAVTFDEANTHMNYLLRSKYTVKEAISETKKNTRQLHIDVMAWDIATKHGTVPFNEAAYDSAKQNRSLDSKINETSLMIIGAPGEYLVYGYKLAEDFFSRDSHVIGITMNHNH
jgi:hypothetical protein